MEKLGVLYEGKAKIIYRTDEEDKLVMFFKDSATAFDGVKKAQIEGKGSLNARITATIFELLESKGIKTHFIGQLSDRELIVWRAQRYPVEVVVRNLAAGSVCKRLGFKEGFSFKKPLVELFYKSDELHDPLICVEHVDVMELAPVNDIPVMKDIALEVNRILSEMFEGVGIRLVDFKLEFGKLPDGSLAVVDEITPDSMRLWDIKSGEKLDKDRFRFDLGDLLEGYRKVFDRMSSKQGRK
jgi:phosphoribosylaminoimidazole-succinocarboxamide synthase